MPSFRDYVKGLSKRPLGWIGGEPASEMAVRSEVSAAAEILRLYESGDPPSGRPTNVPSVLRTWDTASAAPICSISGGCLLRPAAFSRPAQIRQQLGTGQATAQAGESVQLKTIDIFEQF